MLTVELVPASTWGMNLRDILKPSVWDNLRRNCYKAAGHKCEICGERGYNGRVECHERWEFDDLHTVQKLVGVIALCPTCHWAKHIGLTMSKFPAKLKSVLAKVAKINNWTREQVNEHIEDSFAVFNIRSEREWNVDVSWLADNEGMLQ